MTQWWVYLWKRDRLTDIESRLWWPKCREGRWGMEQEFEISRYKLLYIEWINNKVLLHSTDNYIQYSVINNNGKNVKNYIYIYIYIYFFFFFPWWLSRKESACNAGDSGSIPVLGRSLGKGNGNSLQYSCPGNPHGQRSLVSCSPWGCKRVEHHLTTKTIFLCMCVCVCVCVGSSPLQHHGL